MLGLGFMHCGHGLAVVVLSVCTVYIPASAAVYLCKCSFTLLLFNCSFCIPHYWCDHFVVREEITGGLN